MTAADNCVADDRNIARLDTVVAPYLASMGMVGVGSLQTGRMQEAANLCLHYRSSLEVSWSQAAALSAQGWSFFSHTASYPGRMATLTSPQSYDETCGSAQAIDAHGLRGAHGMIAYPGSQPLPTALQTNYGASCFAWGRRYGRKGTTDPSAGSTAPYWQNTGAPNGGPCNDATAACYHIAATGSTRYRLPSAAIANVDRVQPGQWYSLQAYVLVTGTNPPYTGSNIKWDCTSADPRLHWSNDNERYCYSDWQLIVAAIQAKRLTVTDPLTVGIAYGRPAVYPTGG